MNRQKQIEKRNDSYKKKIAKKEAVKERETWIGKARMRNHLAAELFEPVETDELDFRMF